jgi:hypothetical protein
VGEKDNLFIVGGGPSLEGFDFSRLSTKSTIVVNNSIFDVPNPDYFITMDYTWLLKHGILVPCENRMKFLSRGVHKVFVVAFAGDAKRCKWTKGGVIDGNIGLEYDLSLFDQVVPASRYGGIGLDYSDFRCGSDSGFSALQLGVILGYKKIFLLGIDFKVVKKKSVAAEIKNDPKEVWVSISRSGKKKLPKVIAIKSCHKTHYHKDMPRAYVKDFENKLQEFLSPYPNAFQQISEKTECKVYSCSPISALNEHIPYIDIERALSNDS